MDGLLPGHYTNSRFNKGNLRNKQNSERYGELDDQTSRPSTSLAGSSYSDYNSLNESVTFKSNNRGGNHKSWDGKTDLVCKQVDTKFSSQNGQPRNNSGQRSHLHMKIPVNKKKIRNSSIILRKSYLTGFYMVKVQNVEDSDEVLKRIQTYITPIVFYPYNKRYSNNTLRFFVNDYTIANALHSSSYKITDRDDRKLTIKVLPYFPTLETISYTSVSNEVRGKMEEALVTRYNPSTNCLDLSKFYASKLFTDNQLFVPLNQPAFLLAALKMVAQHTNKNLYGLSLENNHIYLDQGLHWIHRLFPELKVLDLGGNKFTDLNQLKSLSSYTIEVLNLSRNPVCCTEDKEGYRRDVLRLFPMLNKLDNLELPFRDSAIIGSKFKMPVNLGNSFPIPEGHNPEEPNPVTAFVEIFLSKYYERYDNRRARKKVVEAYHENATFTLSSCILSETSKGSLGMYLPKSRNLLSTDQYKQLKGQNVHKGRKNIVQFLVKLPITKHDFGSFIVDVPISNNNMVQIILNGVFSEEFKKAEYGYRSFCRTFCMVPDGSGWSILSDMLFVTTINDELIFETAKRFFGFGKAKKKKKEKKISTMEITEQMSCMELSYQQSPILNYPPRFCQQSIFSSYLSLPMMNQQPPHMYEEGKIQASIPHVEQQMVPAATAISSQLDTKMQLTSSFPMYNAVPASMTEFTTISTPVSLPVNQSSTEAHINVINDICVNPDKLSMVKCFSTESGMNNEWAKKCLEENGWDYAKAALRFVDLKANIPPVAFIH